jgi:hypothetical protein
MDGKNNQYVDLIESYKSNKRSMARTIRGRQKGKAKERPKDEQPTRTKKKRERASPSHDRKLSHSRTFNVA